MDDTALLPEQLEGGPLAAVLAARCVAFVRPLLVQLDEHLDCRLVRTLAQSVVALVAHRNRPAALLLSELGAYLDPLADKALIVSIYVALGVAGALPISLVILVVSRDVMIISGFMLSWLIGKPMPVRPLTISKANTVAQIFLATLVLAEQGFHFNAALLSTIAVLLVAVLTVLSIAFYLAEWVRHMNSFGAAH